VADYKDDLLNVLSITDVHSAEESFTDDSGLNVYDHPWRSEKVSQFFIKFYLNFIESYRILLYSLLNFIVKGFIKRNIG
jgi:hypothetical protein